MPDASSFTLFLAASLALLIVPGPAVVYIVARSIDQGVSAGIMSAMGLAAGSVILIVAAAFGVSALLAASPASFDVVRYLGAAYLLYLGIRTLMSRPKEAGEVRTPRAPLRRIFLEGIVVNLLNPKTALFFFAFLPQFVDRSGNVPLQIFILGTVFTLMGVFTDSIYASAAGAVADKLRNDSGFPRIRRLTVATTYIVLAALALVVHPTKL